MISFIIVTPVGNSILTETVNDSQFIKNFREWIISNDWQISEIIVKGEIKHVWNNEARAGGYTTAELIDLMLDY